MVWQLSKQQLVSQCMVLGVLVICGLLFVRSLAPPFPERVDHVRMTPLSPLIDVSEVGSDNGMALVLPWAKVPVPLRPVEAIEGIWRRGRRSCESEIATWLNREKGRIALMHRALAAPEFIWPTNRLGQVERHLHSLSDAGALRMVLTHDGDEALRLLEQGLREAEMMSSPRWVRLEFIGEEMYRALFKGALTRWMYGEGSFPAERERALALLEEVVIPARGLREAEKMRMWVAVELPQRFPDYFRRASRLTAKRQRTLLERYQLHRTSVDGREDPPEWVPGSSKEASENRLRDLLSVFIAQQEREEWFSDEESSVYRLWRASEWSKAYGKDPVARTMVENVFVDISTGVGQESFTPSISMDLCQDVALAGLRLREVIETYPEQTLQEQATTWSASTDQRTPIFWDIDQGALAFGIAEKGVSTGSSSGSSDLNVWGSHSRGALLVWPRKGE